MNYGEALEVGRQRAEWAAEAIRRWAGVEALPVCAVLPAPGRGAWLPVGLANRKEVVRDDGFRGAGRYYLAIVDEFGTPKACSRGLFERDEVIRLARRIPISAAPPRDSELRRQIDRREAPREPRDRALHIEA